MDVQERPDGTFSNQEGPAHVFNVRFMSFGQSVIMSKLVLNVKYLLLLSFLTVAEFYNLGLIQGSIRGP